MIATHPQSITCDRGETARFSCLAHSTSNYVWFRNKQRIKGRTGHILTLTNVSPEEEALYSCKVSNAAGSVTSNEAKLCLGKLNKLANYEVALLYLFEQTLSSYITLNYCSTLSFRK